MKLLIQGSPLGVMPHYLAADGAKHASTLRELLGFLGDGMRAIDPVGLRQYFDRRPDGERTCFRNAKLLPAGLDLYQADDGLRCSRRELPKPDLELLPLMEQVLGELLSQNPNFVVALSRGLDSALVLALAQRLRNKPVPVVTLATRLVGYCELEQTLETARLLGVDSVEVIDVGGQDLVAALPSAIAACETPLFNLHPVSRILLARAVAHCGYDAMLTGDGADQVFAGSDARNYLPIVGAMARATRLAFVSPFFDERIVGWARNHGADAEKTMLRQAASQILPPELVWRKKSARLAPEFELNQYRDLSLENKVAPLLGLKSPDSRPGPEQTLWATTALLARHLGGTC
jgi:asparagine synthase (glutamine-hydrolysing)